MALFSGEFHETLAKHLWSMSLAVVLLATACGGTDDNGAAPSDDRRIHAVTLRLDWIVDGSHAPFFAALDQGFFEEEGLAVEILEGGGSGLAATLVGNKENDFGFADAGVVAKSVEEGVPLKVVMGIYQRNKSVIMSLESSGIRTPQDLTGKKVGATQGEAPLQLLQAYLESNGVDPGTVDVINMDPAAKAPALFQGRVDAIVNFSTVIPLVEQSAPEPLVVQHYADFGVVSLSNGIVAHPDLIENDSDVVASFVRAVQKGFEYSLENPDSVIKGLVDRFPNTVQEETARAVLDIALSGLHTERTKGEPIGVMHPADWEETGKILREVGVLTGEKPVDEYFTNEFLDTE